MQLIALIAGEVGSDFATLIKQLVAPSAHILKNFLARIGISVIGKYVFG